MKLVLSLLMFSTFLLAQTQQLIIDAKNFEANDKKGISVFTGNVKIQMGKDKLNAQKVEMFFVNRKGSTNKVPSKYIATGKVDFEIVTDTKHYVGNGDKIIYSPLKQEYTVMGNGFLQEKNDDRKIYGDKIYVNQLSGEAKVNGSDKKPVRFIINVERGSEK
ncbi:MULTISPECIES: lipopolysaccharide transport periplasmic protein LptA [Arcobacteraceae]|uniref:Lipopolysaccharide transport periplasmic protein LptA n=1 Tax=Poseidonibacter parvus TaxID=1850254 RepID=A0A1P8KN18_9BACT|nr:MULTISPECIES: lipopolysaccharide transport periplasmic protein LptA [Arcobacteraceae]APW65951.1 lipopolysaccharide transport periplasmic protein LptA [Poseidonibacter parvus]